LTTIAVDPINPKIIYVGSAGQLGHEGCGVWKTTNGGQTWVPISDSLPMLSIGAIAIDRIKYTGMERIYIVTADKGLYGSTDAGGTWTNIHGDLRIRTNTVDGDRTVLLINPKKSNVLYVTSDDGVLRSENYGKSWQKSLDAGSATNRGASSLVMDPLNPDVLYAAIVGKGIYKTDNGGTTGWTLQKGMSYTNMSKTILLAITHPSSSSSEIVYALLPNKSGWFDLFRTTDGGKNWSKRYQTPRPPCCSPPPPCPYTYNYLVMGVDPTDWKVLYLGGQLFWTSSDGGDTFTKVPAVLPSGCDTNDRQPASPHGDYWELVVDPTNPGVLYAGSDGGIYRSADHGKEGTWEFIGEGITNVEMYDLALANTWSSRAISGIQDNGLILYNGTLVWQQLSGGDGAAVAIDPTNPDRFYAVLDNRGTPFVSSDAGGIFANFSSGLSVSTNCEIWDMTSHLLIHPVNSHILLEPCQSLWQIKTAVPAGKWVSIFTPPAVPPPSIHQVVRSAVDPKFNIYYAGTNLGRIYAGVGGSGWKQVFAHPDSLNVSDIEVDKAHPETVYVSFAPPYSFVGAVPWERNCSANAGTRRVYQLKTQISSGSVSVKAFDDITSNLRSEVCVNALAVDPFTAGVVYAATNKGVYRGKGGAPARSWKWQSYNNGMPEADVRDLEVHPVSRNIFAATFGRSAFKVAPEKPSSQ
jgi:hypothetical protein